MKNTQNITLVLLMITATMLTTLLVAGYVYTEPAYGGASSAKGGDYIMATGAYNQEADFVYVLDIASNKLNIYYPDININGLRLGDTVDLARAFQAAAKQP